MAEEDIPKQNRTLGMIARELREESADSIESSKESLFQSGFSSTYKFKSELAQGGIKVIKVMTDLRTGRDVAVAQLRPELVNQKNVERFLQEAKILACLEHSNIVPLYEINYDDNNLLYFSMKLLGGETLASVLKKIRSGDEEYIKKYPQRKLLMIMMQICDAMSFAHSRSIVHLDLKPENIQISDYGEVLILDWGFAKQLGQDHDSSYEADSPAEFKSIATNLTRAGAIHGTPGYMSPEQTTSGEDLTHSSDIYSAGAILYSILTLKRPHEELSEEECVERTRNGHPLEFAHSSNKAIDKTLTAITLKAMSNKAEARYGRIDNLGSDIDSFLNDFTPEAAEPSLIHLFSLFIKRNRKAILISTAILMSLASSLYWQQQSQLSEEQALIEKEKSDIKDKATFEQVLSGTLNRDEELRKTCSYEEALKMYIKLTDIDYNHPTLWYKRARLHAGELDLQDAINCLNKAIESEPDIRKDNRFRKLLKFSDKYIKILRERELTTDEIIRYALDTGDDDLQRHLLWNINTSNKTTLKQKMGVLKKYLTMFNAALLKKELNMSYTIDEKNKVRLDLSNNPKMQRITPVLGLPIYKLNLSNTDVGLTPEGTFIKSTVHVLIINGVNRIFHNNFLPDSKFRRIEARNSNFAALVNLHRAKHLKHLDLQNSDADTQVIKVSKSLEYLNVAYTKFDNFKLLLQFTKLKTLVIDKGMKIDANIRKQLIEKGVYIIQR